MPHVSRARAVAYLLALLLVLTLGGRFALGGTGQARSEEHRASATGPGPAAIETAAPRARMLFVHVVGAVRRPGLYRLEEGSRVADAIRRAGGAGPRAVLARVNLAAPVADGQQVVVPHRGEEPAATSAGGAPAPGVPVAKVRLNSATLEELDTLPGVGPVTAQKILDYRAEHGAFRSIDELDAVSGIGPATLAELKPLVDL